MGYFYTFNMVVNQDQTSVVFSVLFSISFAVGAICNVAILILTWRKKVFKNTFQARLLIAHSSVVDLLSSLYYLQSSIGFLNPNLLTTKKYICHGLSFFNGTIIPQMHHSFMLLAIHRYLIIKEPLRCRSIFTDKKTYAYIACTWLFSVLKVVAAQLTNSKVSYQPIVGTCMFISRRTLGAALIIARSSIFLITIVFYVKAYLAFFKSQRRVGCMEDCSDWSSQLDAKGTSENGSTHFKKIQQNDVRTGKIERSKSHSDIFIRQAGHPPESYHAFPANRKRSKSVSAGMKYFQGHSSAMRDGIDGKDSNPECSSTDVKRKSSFPGVKLDFFINIFLI